MNIVEDEKPLSLEYIDIEEKTVAVRFWTGSHQCPSCGKSTPDKKDNPSHEIIKGEECEGGDPTARNLIYAVKENKVLRLIETGMVKQDENGILSSSLERNEVMEAINSELPLAG